MALEKTILQYDALILDRVLFRNSNIFFSLSLKCMIIIFIFLVSLDHNGGLLFLDNCNIICCYCHNFSSFISLLTNKTQKRFEKREYEIKIWNTLWRDGLFKNCSFALSCNFLFKKIINGVIDFLIRKLCFCIGLTNYFHRFSFAYLRYPHKAIWINFIE